MVPNELHVIFSCIDTSFLGGTHYVQKDTFPHVRRFVYYRVLDECIIHVLIMSIVYFILFYFIMVVISDSVSILSSLENQNR